jgi:tRNA dimethylallyltransferase
MSKGAFWLLCSFIYTRRLGMNNNNNYVVMIYGPTGVGKTDFVDQLALALPKQISMEIINGDMGQMYTALSIGTAKPDLTHTAAPHHLFDIINNPVDFTVVMYRQLVQKTMSEIQARRHLPVIVGGSTFYLNALFFPPTMGGDDCLNESGLQDDANGWEKLYEIDPKRACEIKPDDLYRVNRALAIWRSTGKKPSDCMPTYNPIAPFYVICLTRDRDDLYRRINSRVVHMLEHGWVEEVKALCNTPWNDFILRKKIIGYDDIIRYLDGAIDYTTMVAVIQKRTRNYAKRQMTYWRMLERKLKKTLDDVGDSRSGIELVNLTSLDVQSYIKTLQKKLDLLCIREQYE